MDFGEERLLLESSARIIEQLGRLPPPGVVPALAGSNRNQVDTRQMGRDALTSGPITESSILATRSHRIDLIECSVQFTSGKGTHVQGGMGTLPARLPITHVDGGHPKRGAFDQTRTAVSDEGVETTKQTDEGRSIQVIDHEESRAPDRIEDSRSTGISIGFEHHGGTSLGDRFEDGAGTCTLIGVAASGSMKHDRESWSTEFPPARITERRHRIETIDGR